MRQVERHDAGVVSIPDAITEHPLAGKKVAVVGAGIAGLTTALHLQSIGAKVRIYSPIVPGGKGWGSEINPAPMASEVSGASWKPYHLDFPNAEEADRVLCRSWDWYQSLIEQEVPGVFMMRHFEASSKPITSADIAAKAFYLKMVEDVRLREYYEQHPDERRGGDYALSYNTIHINPREFLPALVEMFRANGGEIEELDGNYENMDQIITLPGEAIFLCTGLGAGALLHDDMLHPEAGEVMVYDAIAWNKSEEPYSVSSAHAPNPDGIPYVANQYIYPHTTHATGGGTGYPGDLRVMRTGVEEWIGDGVKRNLDDHAVVDLTTGRKRVGHRPSRDGGVRMEAEIYTRTDGTQVLVGYNYGHGGAGMTTAPGTALLAVERVEERKALLNS